MHENRSTCWVTLGVPGCNDERLHVLSLTGEQRLPCRRTSQLWTWSVEPDLNVDVVGKEVLKYGEHEPERPHPLHGSKQRRVSDLVDRQAE